MVLWQLRMLAEQKGIGLDEKSQDDDLEPVIEEALFLGCDGISAQLLVEQDPSQYPSMREPARYYFLSDR